MESGISPHVVSVGPHQGRTSILVDGKPLTGMAYLGPMTFPGQPETATSSLAEPERGGPTTMSGALIFC